MHLEATHQLAHPRRVGQILFFGLFATLALHWALRSIPDLLQPDAPARFSVSLAWVLTVASLAALVRASSTLGRGRSE